MSKTLVIAEKPSVGRDLVRVLPGAFAKHEGYLEGPDHIVSWAVGHLVQLADPDEYEERFKKWRMADLPIVPDRFKLVVRDERSKKQMNVVKRLLGSSEVQDVVNACDAGREGELIFAYLFEKAGSRKSVQRLWLNSMTTGAIKDAFAALRPAEELASLEAAARSRSEADWIVGMNATRAATIRLRSSFDGAVSLGRVQTPTLAILARREQEIRDFKPEPYWIVDASFDTTAPAGRLYEGRFHAGANPRIKTAEEAAVVVSACEGRSGEITKLEKSERKERAPLLYDLTSLQRDANGRFGFSARRTLAAAQRLYEEHKALTYPRTNSRFITGDMIGEIKPIAALVGDQREYAKASEYVLGLDVLPLARVVNDAKVTDHHAIIPTRAERHPVDKFSDDDRRIYDLVVRRFLAIFHPEAVFENTRVETTVAQHIFRTRGRVMLVPGWRGVYGESADVEGASRSDEDEGREQQLPKLERGEDVSVRRVASEAKETKPPRRFTEGALLAAMETAGKLVEEEELREAMKESGIGTPATRAAIIERLLQVGYIERDGRALVVTEKGLNLAQHDRRLGAPAGEDRGRRRQPQGIHGRHRQVHPGDRDRAGHQAQGRADSAGESGPLPGLRPRHHGEPQGLLLLVTRGSRLWLRHLEVQGRQAAAAGSRAGADQDGADREAGHRLQGPLGQGLPGPAGPAADRGGQVARGVRRAVGQGGGQAPRERGRSHRRAGGRSRAGRGRLAALAPGLEARPLVAVGGARHHRSDAADARPGPRELRQGG